MKVGSTKAPKKTKGFSWQRGYSAEKGITGWRLYRWDANGKLHRMEMYAMPESPRWQQAQQLRATCHQLRDQIDDIDLQVLGII